MIAVAWAHGKAVHNRRTGDGNKICKLAAMKQNENKEWPGFLIPLPPPSGAAGDHNFSTDPKLREQRF